MVGLGHCVQLAILLGFFVDETVDTSVAAYNFFRTGIYFGGRNPMSFDPELSTGLPVTWISGLVWNFGGSLLQQRTLLIGWQSVLFFLVSVAFVRWEEPGKKSTRQTLAAAWIPFCGIWLAYLALVPNWLTFLQNLGEVPGCAFLAAGFLFRARRPLLAGALGGIAVWGCKFVQLPAALLFFFLLPIYEWLRGQRNAEQTRRILLRAAIGFFIPLLCWLSWIAVRTDISSAITWPYRLLEFVLFRGASGYSNAEYLSLGERLSSPAFEWMGYRFAIKWRILALTFAPFLIYGIDRALRRLDHRPSSNFLPGIRRDSFFVVFFLLNGLYGIWWFFFHPNMIYRHYQSALVLSLLACLFYLRGLVWPLVMERWKWAFVMVPLLFLAFFVNAFAAIYASPVRPRLFVFGCRENLITPSCLSPVYWKVLSDFAATPENNWAKYPPPSPGGILPPK